MLSYYATGGLTWNLYVWYKVMKGDAAAACYKCYKVKVDVLELGGHTMEIRTVYDDHPPPTELRKKELDRLSHLLCSSAYVSSAACSAS